MKTSQLILFGFSLASGLLLADERVRLALVVQFPSNVSPETRTAMEREVRQTVQVDWLGVEWREMSQYDSAEPFELVMAVRVRGTCAPFGSGLAKDGPLGITHISDGKILPFIEVDCDRVARAIEPRVFPRGNLPPYPALGRALGRVAAHEMYHVLAQTQQHEAGGVARARFGQNELLLQPMLFSPSLLRREKFLPKQGD